MKNIENNRLIAEFMAFQTRTDAVDDRVLAYYVGNVIKNADNSKNENEENVFHPEDMRFDTDWNWLIEVVEKIKKLDYSLNMQYLSCQGYIVSNKGYNAINNHIEIAIVSSIPNKFASKPPTAENPIFVSEFDCPKEALYNLVLRFIKWYNEKK